MCGHEGVASKYLHQKWWLKKIFSVMKHADPEIFSNVKMRMGDKKIRGSWNGPLFLPGGDHHRSDYSYDYGPYDDAYHVWHVAWPRG